MRESEISARKLTITAILMAMNIIMSTSILSIPVPGGHMYLNDVIIVTAAVLLEPFYAMLVGGLGAFIGDMLFYPTPMFVSLVTHGLQAYVISLFVHRILKGKGLKAAIVGSLLGWVITVVGYSFGRAYIYGTPAYALLKLPFQILQTGVGSAIALFLCYKLKLVEIFEKQFLKTETEPENKTSAKQ